MGRSVWAMVAPKSTGLARRETIRLNGGDVSTGNSVDEEQSNASSSDEDFKTMCHNGNCAWKMSITK